MTEEAIRWDSPMGSLRRPTNPPAEPEITELLAFFRGSAGDSTAAVLKSIALTTLRVVPAITVKSDAMTYRKTVLAPLLALIATPLLGLGVFGAIVSLAMENMTIFFWAMVALFIGASLFRIALILRPRPVKRASV